MNKKRKYKSLKLKAEHLKLELEDRLDESSKLEREFLEHLSNVSTEEIQHNKVEATVVEVNVSAPDENQQGDVDVPDPNVVQEEHPEEFKKLWKQIATTTHPDKTGNDPEKTEMYKKAAAAWNKKDYAELARIAMEIGIHLSEDSELSLEVLEKSVENLEKQIKDAEQSVLWMWATAPQDKKDKIIDLYLLSKGKKRKTT